MTRYIKEGTKKERKQILWKRIDNLKEETIEFLETQNSFQNSVSKNTKNKTKQKKYQKLSRWIKQLI